MARLLGAGASGWWCSREAFSATAILRAGGLHVREGLGVGGKGEKEVPGNRWPRQDPGFQTRGWEGAGHLHLEAVRELLLPTQRREKSCRRGGLLFIQTEGSNTPNTERMDEEKTAGRGMREATVRTVSN